MIDSSPPPVHEQPLGDELKYLRALAVRYPGTIEFESGAGHIFQEFFARLPSIPQLEDQKTALCHRLAAILFPLTANLCAKSVGIIFTAEDNSLVPPEVTAGLATYTAFDIERGVLSHSFIAPPYDSSYIEALSIPSGVGMLCEPRDYAGRQILDTSRDPSQRAPDTMWQWTERMIKEWYRQKAGQSFVPVALRFRSSTIVAAHTVGIVEAAAVAMLQSASDVPASIAAPRSGMTAAFVHEAAFAETGVQSKKPAAKKMEKTAVPEGPEGDAEAHAPHLHPHIPTPDVQ